MAEGLALRKDLPVSGKVSNPARVLSSILLVHGLWWLCQAVWKNA